MATLIIVINVKSNFKGSRKMGIEILYQPFIDFRPFLSLSSVYFEMYNNKKKHRTKTKKNITAKEIMV